jgi:uncharacterized protein with GYD domain
MSTYVVLARWTNQGLQKIKESPSRIDAGRKAFEKAGLKLKTLYVLTGQYDLMLIIEAPDDAALAKAILTIGSQGNIQTETLRAFTEDEFRKIISGLA